MNLFIITPYEAMVTPIKEAMKNFLEIHIDYGVGDLYEGVELAIEAEKNEYDAIISRGGTAQLIQKNVKIPVIDMKLSGYDILRTIVLANNQQEKTALIGFPNITSGANAIIDLLDMLIDIYTIQDQSELNSLLLKLKKNNVTQIIGDVITTKKSEDSDFNALLLQSGEETIRAAIKQAYFVLNQLSQEENINSLLAKSFGFTYSNYIMMDEQSIITSKLVDFKDIPISNEQIMDYIYKLQQKEKNIFYTFVLSDSKLSIKVMAFEHYSQIYYLFIFDQYFSKEITVEGVSLYTRNLSYKLISKSNAMRDVLNNVDDLLNKGNIIYLLGQDKFTQENVIEYIENKLSTNKPTLLIDLDLLDLTNFYNMDLDEYRIILLKNIKDSEKLIEFKNYIKPIDIPLLILEQNDNNTEIINFSGVSPIRLPKTSERVDDLYDIVKYLIGYYHNNNGTKPVKMEQEILEYFKSYLTADFETIITILKIAIYSEKRYTLSLKTIKEVENNNVFSKKENGFLDTSKTLKEIEIEYVKKILEEEEFNQSQAAERLGISRATLWRKIKDNQL